MELGLDVDHLKRHEMPFIVKFHGDNDCPALNESTISSIWDGRLWMAANYTECGIKTHEIGSKIVFEQIVEVKYGNRMTSSDVYRHFTDTYNASCLIDRNVTHILNVDVGINETVNEKTYK